MLKQLRGDSRGDSTHPTYDRDAASSRVKRLFMHSQEFYQSFDLKLDIERNQDRSHARETISWGRVCICKTRYHSQAVFL